MFNEVKKEVQWGDETLTLETGKIARQADGAVLVTYGGTSVLCAVTAAKEPKAGIDFFPLTVSYIEKFYAGGKIPGGFFKREGRPTEKETLTSRLIDRPIRPLFDANFCNETQVVCTVVSYDSMNDPDVVAMVGASAALAISGVPFNGPIAGARVGLIEGKFVLNPTVDALEESELDLFVAGTKDSVMMVESEAKVLSEEKMLEAVVFGHKEMQKVIKLINDLAKDAGKERWVVEAPDHSALFKTIKAAGEKSLRAAYKETDKQTRVEKISAAKSEVITKLTEDLADGEELDDKVVGGLFKKLEKEIVRGDVLKTGKRIDGRDTKTVRQIIGETSVLTQTHGSTLFTRGETQALVVTTLGSGQDEQRIDSLAGDTKEHFMLHYNFPPYSVGEAYMMRPPGRREIGHGKLAWRALRAVLPEQEDFPYTIRVVSEITESNGSSSMATVCGASLSMMDAGVPLKSPVSGIAMGLIKDGDDYAILSDILGDEDHLGDMDFKVAGPEGGITALQMDIKIDGITPEIMKIALEQAKEGRMHILGEMAKALGEAREEVNEKAPKITSLQVPTDKIRDIIGSGGATIRELCEVTGAKIDIDNDGTVKIAAVSGKDADLAVSMIQEIIAEPIIGEIYEGPVMKVVDFGAFVKFLGKTEGLVHISELASERVGQVTDVVNEGDIVKVKLLNIERGKYRLSIKALTASSDDKAKKDAPKEEKKPEAKKRFKKML
jgi:polyribonucleotide nucleotidyltransferase